MRDGGTEEDVRATQGVWADVRLLQHMRYGGAEEEVRVTQGE